MKRCFVFCLVLCVCFGVSVTDLASQTKKVTAPQKLKVPVSKLRLKFRTDLRVDVIHSSRCKCDLGDVNAFYMANIMVDVSNHKKGNVGTAAASVLTVKYFDMNRGRLVTITKNLAVMNPYPKNPWTFQRVVVMNRPVLVKRSVGITATIRPKSKNVADPVPANNKKVVRKCSPMVY